MINNIAYGGFVVSNNILKGVPIRYSYREQSSIKQLNGWTLLSEKDDNNYVNNPKNFTIINAESMYKIAPQLLEIYEAPYGKQICYCHLTKIY
ncbi:uncharacterized protein DUF2185 [Mobilisporobacter senegalensis]|uniref:Uncharacterized protein DUF2185 n=1 Tax=Mobilisporobacter senegalensis TaxID=1329262 RepID=A0A3N1XYQ7_9FIRM|nr:DUF2185 domain-containing protein [Mobilisporobacter senegalensis]ROR31428.1 uncharacterized protein DUF2185 [Mobilisporobacter senegalensis]